MKRLRLYMRAHWRLAGCIGLGLAAMCSLLLYRLGSLTSGISANELNQQFSSSSWHSLAHNPLQLPLTVLQWMFLTVSSHHGQTTTRLPSAIFGFLTVSAFVYVLRRWYGVKTAIFGGVLFGTSAWFLHASRLAGPAVMYLWAVPTLLAAHIVWERHHSKPVVSFLIALLFGIMLYIPGMLWLLLVSFGMQPHHLTNAWASLTRTWQRIVLPLIFISVVAPLAIAIIITPALGKTWLGLPASFADPSEIPRRLAQSVSFFIWRGPLEPALWLDRLPILGIFATIMVVLGVFFYAKHFRAPRTRLLAGLFIVGAIFYALGGPVGFSVLVPIVYFIVVGGVGYLLHEWLHVFPSNPLARSVGYVLLSIAIIISCSYNLRAYFVAWPHNAATKATFSKRL